MYKQYKSLYTHFYNQLNFTYKNNYYKYSDYVNEYILPNLYDDVISQILNFLENDSIHLINFKQMLVIENDNQDEVLNINLFHSKIYIQFYYTSQKIIINSQDGKQKEIITYHDYIKSKYYTFNNNSWSFTRHLIDWETNLLDKFIKYETNDENYLYIGLIKNKTTRFINPPFCVNLILKNLNTKITINHHSYINKFIKYENNNIKLYFPKTIDKYQYSIEDELKTADICSYNNIGLLAEIYMKLSNKHSNNYENYITRIQYYDSHINDDNILVKIFTFYGLIIFYDDNNIILYDELIYFKKLNQDYNYIRDNFSWRIVYYNVNKRKDNKIGIITNNITGIINGYYTKDKLSMNKKIQNILHNLYHRNMVH